MKHTIVLLTVCFCASQLQAQYNTTINATLKDLPAGKWVYWQPATGDPKIDSVKTESGQFTIKMYIPEGAGNVYTIVIGKEEDNVEKSVMDLYLEKGEVTIKGNSPSFKNVEFSGPQYMQDFNCFYKEVLLSPTIKAQEELHNKFYDLVMNNDTLAAKELQPEMVKLTTEELVLIKQWINKHKASPVCMYLLSNSKLSWETIAEKENIFNQLTPAAKRNLLAKDFLNVLRVDKLTGIGKQAMDFTQNDTLDRPVSLKDFRGKYVLLDFWASWCEPCRAENPNVVAAFNKYKNKNFTVLGISLDNNKEKWLAAIHEDGLIWTHVSDLKHWNNCIAKLYGADYTGIPFNILVDPNGTIIARNLSGEQLHEKLNEILL